MKQTDLTAIADLIQKANSIIEKGTGRSADEAMEMLKLHAAELKAESDYIHKRTSSSDSVASEATDLGNLTFTYEEEADP
jgi:hypothetical protein